MLITMPGLARLAAAGLIIASSPAVVAQPSPSPPDATPQACGYVLTDPVLMVWRDLGGESGRLGCPTARESASTTSVRGSASRVAAFGLNGEIVLHASGARAGQAFAVTGCAYRLYSQFGGPSGWLGLPVADAENTPDGSRQAFEGGVIRYARAVDSCEATPAPTAAAPQSVTAETVAAETATPLEIVEDPATGDRLSLASQSSLEEAVAAGFRRLRTQARVMTALAPGTTALKVFFNEATGRRQVLAAPQSEREALAAGFAFEAGQGFVWIDQHPGAVALKQYRQSTTGQTRLTASDQEEAEATDQGYRFERIEGYALPPS